MLFEPSILVYDDDSVVGLELAYVLRNAGYDKIEFASHYEPALRALERHATIDLLLADIVVPNGLNGIALARMACLRQPLISVILITGYNTGPVEQKLGWPILAKPVPDDLLIAEVGRALLSAPDDISAPSC